MSPFPKLYLESLRKKTINIIDSFYATRWEWKIEHSNFHIANMELNAVLQCWTSTQVWLCEYQLSLGMWLKPGICNWVVFTFFEKCLWFNCVALHSNHYQKKSCHKEVAEGITWRPLLHKSLTFPVFNVSVKELPLK